MLIATVWAYFFLPETKGRTLDDFDVILYVESYTPLTVPKLTIAVAMSRIDLRLLRTSRASISQGTRTMWSSIRKKEWPRFAVAFCGIALVFSDCDFGFASIYSEVNAQYSLNVFQSTCFLNHSCS